MANQTPNVVPKESVELTSELAAILPMTTGIKIWFAYGGRTLDEIKEKDWILCETVPYVNHPDFGQVGFRPTGPSPNMTYFKPISPPEDINPNVTCCISSRQDWSDPNPRLRIYTKNDH